MQGVMVMEYKRMRHIFAVQRQFPVRNGVLVRTPSPLRQTTASTIHSAQGCTVQEMFYRHVHI